MWSYVQSFNRALLAFLNVIYRNHLSDFMSDLLFEERNVQKAGLEVFRHVLVSAVLSGTGRRNNLSFSKFRRKSKPHNVLHPYNNDEHLPQKIIVNDQDHRELI